MRAAPAVSYAKKSGMRARACRLSGGTRHPLRDGSTAYAALSPVIGLVCHRRRRSLLRQLDASVGASGPHGFAVRSNVVRPARPPIAHEVQPALRHQWCADALCVHHIPSRVRDDARPPLLPEQDGRIWPLIWVLHEAEFCPSCQSAASRRASAWRAALTDAMCQERTNCHRATDIVKPPARPP
jgi:hypothetical protein